MLKNYFKIALRNLNRNKAYAGMNAVGLALGIACTIGIFTLVKYHLSFDRFHSNADRIYRITTELHQAQVNYNPGVPSPLGEALRSDYTFAEKVARVATFSNRVISFPSSNRNNRFEEDIAFAEPEFFEIFDYPLLKGQRNTFLTKPNTAFVTERIAKKYFSDEDPIGKVIRLDNTIDFIISGILRDLPANTDRRQEIYLSFYNLKDHSPWLVEEDWWLSVNKAMQCFVLLKQGVSPAMVDQALSDMSSKHYTAKDAEIFRFKLQPVSDMHFNANLGGYVEKKYLWALSIIGLFLLGTSCVNFVNLATAHAVSRSKEIGVRKVLGSPRWQIFWQFIAETTVIVVLSTVLAFFVVDLALPSMNLLLNTQLKVNPFQDVYILTFLPVLLLVVIFASGSYPGLVLAGFQPILALKGKVAQRQVGGASLRKGLVITQFAISQMLIIGTIVISNQMGYSTEADMGFQKDGIVMLPLPSNQTSEISAFGSQLSRIAGVEKATFCNAAPSSDHQPSTVMQFDARTEAEKFSIVLRAGDDRYVPTFGLQIVEGRNLQPSDTIREYLINETAVKKLDVAVNADVIGKKAIINGKSGTIVGVVKDFHNQSFHEDIDPIYITTRSDNYLNCAVKINVSNLRPTLTALEKTWREIYPNHIYKYIFLDDQIERFYKLDYLVLRLTQAFAGIAIVIGCLGLYGLVSFMAAEKTKEVGVRKVLGASVRSIIVLFGREFTRLLLVAFLIAAPLAWWIMNIWLENFVFRIEIGIGIFAAAILITATVAVLTVAYRSIKAALMNPVKSLRSE